MWDLQTIVRLNEKAHQEWEEQQQAAEEPDKIDFVPKKQRTSAGPRLSGRQGERYAV